MAKYLLLKHYRGGPERRPNSSTSMDQWSPEEISDHIGFMDHVADTLRERGEFVEGQALSPEGTFVRYDGDGQAAGDRRTVRGDQGPDRRLDGDRRRLRRARPRGGRLPVLGPRPRRSPAPGVDRGTAVPRGAADRRPSERPARGTSVPRSWASSSAAAPTSRRPRTPCRRRSSRPYAAGRSLCPITGAGRPEGLAGHRRVAQVPRCLPLRDGPPGARGAGRRRAGARADRAGRRHAAAAVPLLPPRP